MLRYFLILIGVAAAIHAEPDSADAFHALVLPGVVAACIVGVIGWSGAAIIGTGVVLFQQIDWTGTGVWASLVAPLLLAGDFLVFLIWAWQNGHFHGSSGISGSDGGSDIGGGDGGGE